MTDDSPANSGRRNLANVSGRQHLGLSVGAAFIGLVTAVGVRLFNQAIAFIQSATGSLEAAGAWTIPLTLALGGVLAALFLHRFGQKTPLTAVPHIIDAVASERIQLHRRNGLVYVLASAWSIGIGAPVGADTPAAMIGGHLGFTLGRSLRQRDLFIRVLVVAGVAAGIAATFFAQLAAIFFALEVVLGGFGGAVYVVPILIAVAADVVHLVDHHRAVAVALVGDLAEMRDDAVVVPDHPGEERIAPSQARDEVVTDLVADASRRIRAARDGGAAAGSARIHARRAPRLPRALGH